MAGRVLAIHILISSRFFTVFNIFNHVFCQSEDSREAVRAA
jgi:hypothetical protein